MVMKRLLFFAFVYFFTPLHFFAQGIQQPGARSELVHSMGQYRFPNFTEGTIIFRNGMMLGERINYNITADEMHFINKTGDTLAIANPGTINFISVNGSRFYYDNGYLQALDTANGIILAFRQRLEEETSNADIVILHPNEWTPKPVTTKVDKSDGTEKLHLDAREFYFFGDGKEHFTKAGKDYILNHFKEKQAAIKSFLKASHTNFNALADLLTLMQFCKKL